MSSKITLGLGVIHAERGEVRAFLPEFVNKIAPRFDKVVLEKGYGSGLGFVQSDYTKDNNVQFGSPEETYAQDLLLVLRYPPDAYLALMPPGSCLISMCHFPTRPQRREFLSAHGIKAISLDAVVDDNGRRLVENLGAVAWNGCEIAFRVLREHWPDNAFLSPERPPLKVTLLGSGGVGAHAMAAAIRYGDVSLWDEYAAQGVSGNIVRVVDYDLTCHSAELEDLLKDTHLLIDATQRRDPSNIIVPNEMLGLMPSHAVILDLSVDPYDCQTEPNEVKGIEGIPQGDLDQYIFAPDDPAWDALPCQIETSNRRWTVSCYSWPGLHPRDCMERYGFQLSPLLRRLVMVGGVEGINPQGRYRERALARGMLK
jgi:alanine dehydrogenase